MRPVALAGWLAGAVFVTAAPVSLDRPGKDAPAVERKLHGSWTGDGCNGDLTFHADGTFERRNYGPGAKGMAGTWAVRWDALPPTLVMTCKNSTAPGDAGQVTEILLVELTDQTLGYRWPDTEGTIRYRRGKK